MKRSHKLAIIAVLATSVVIVGGAIGATQLTPEQEREAVIDDAAGQLGVEPDELSNALEQALKNRVDEAVEDGRLTKEQGERIKERIEAGDVPFFGLGPLARGFGPPGGFERPKHMLFRVQLDAAARYLGMTRAQLHEALHDGKSLAQVAKDRDKSVDALIDALVDAAEKELDEDVEAGRLTESEKNEMLSGLRKRITDFVNGRFPESPRHKLFAPPFHRIDPAPRPGSAPF
jgi:hypothetical protein